MSDNRSSLVNLSRPIALAPRTRCRSRPHGARRGGLGQVNSAGRDVAEYNLERKRSEVSLLLLMIFSIKIKILAQALSRYFTTCKSPCITRPPGTVLCSVSLSWSLSSLTSTLALTLRSVVLLMISLHPSQRGPSVAG